MTNPRSLTVQVFYEDRRNKAARYPAPAATSAPSRCRASQKVHSRAEFHETIYNRPSIYRLFPMNFLFVKLSQNCEDVSRLGHYLFAW